MRRSSPDAEEDEFLGKYDDDESEEGLVDPGSDLYAVLNLPHDASEEDVQRAYRSMARTFHPDKHQDEAVQEAASQSFNRINEAYTVLSDPVKRQIYDIYGLEGLHSGLEVGSKVQSKDELRQQWEKFKQQKKKQELDQNVNYSGVCVLGMNAEGLVDGALPRMATANMLSRVEAPLTHKDTVSIGGQIVTKAKVGGGGFFVMGYRRDFSSNSSLDVHAEAGLRQVLQLTSTRQLSTHTSASISTNWSPRGGLGLDVSTHRQLSAGLSGDLTWTVGPRGADGVALSLHSERERTTLAGALHVGAHTGITGSCIRKLSKKSSVRAGLKLGTMGIEMELGVTRRMGQYGTTGISVGVGIQGITFRLRLSRGGQKFYFPFLVCRHFDWRIALASTLLPPLGIMLVKRLVVKPYLLKLRDREKNALQAATLGGLQHRLVGAAAERRLLDPVSKRKTKKEVGKAGLVVVHAAYGAVDTIHSLAIVPEEGTDALSQHDPAAAADGSSSATGDNGGSRPQPSAHTAAPPTGLWVTAKWIDVTAATQFLVEESQLALHQGVSKAGLMGFCDIAPGQLKELRVIYLNAGQPCLARVGDLQGCSLPSGGAPVADEEDVEAVIKYARCKGLLGSNQIGTGHS